MADVFVTEPLPDLSLVDLSAELNRLPIPNMDSLFFANNSEDLSPELFASDLDLGLDGDLDIIFDDLDDLYIPSNIDEFFLPDASIAPSVQIHDDHDSRANSECNPSSDIPRFSNLQSSPPVSLNNSGDHNSHNSIDVKISSFQSPESDSCDQEFSGGPVSSQGSGNGGSGVYEVMNSTSADSSRDNRAFSSHVIADDNKKLGEIGKSCELKRKIEHNEGNTVVRTTKHRRSSTPMENTTQQSGLHTIYKEDEKRKARLMRNRESALLSRQRKKHYVEELEEKVRSMHSTIADLSSKISFFMADNATLRQQLSAGGMCPTPPPGIYTHPPMLPMAYPSWVLCAPYVVKPQGSQVPLIPIPRLKSQQPVSVSKSKKSERKKSEGKTKKVASISLLGLLFFILLVGGLAPLVNVKFGGLVDDVSGRSSYVNDRFYSQLGGKVWSLNGPRNGSVVDKGVEFSCGRFGISDRLTYERGLKLPLRSDSDEFFHLGNTSEPLVASLYVPRNDKLVKIDGNLIIHSVLASEKAMAPQTAHANNDNRETSLAISKYGDSPLAIPKVGRNRDQHTLLYRSPSEQRKALASVSAQTLKDHLKSSASDGRMQQWFREGLAGPMLSSGMCTEVFQFDASPTPGAIVPVSSVASVTAEDHQNASSVNKSRNRRFLHRLPLAGSGLNATEQHATRNPLNDNFHGNKSMSSMVVSVLLDPKEAGNGDVDGTIAPKSLSRIFVVVLVDSIKYVTYSCGLPRVSSHLVTTEGRQSFL